METLPEVLPILLQTSHSIFKMFAKDCLAPARVDACPIQFEAVGAAIIKPNRQLYANAEIIAPPYPGVKNGVVCYANHHLVAKRPCAIVVIHARIHAIQASLGHLPRYTRWILQRRYLHAWFEPKQLLCS